MSFKAVVQFIVHAPGSLKKVKDIVNSYCLVPCLCYGSKHKESVGHLLMSITCMLGRVQLAALSLQRN